MEPACLFWVIYNDYSILSSQKWPRLGCMSGFKPSAALQNPGLQLSLAKLWGRTPPIPPAYFLESHAVTHNWQMSSVRQLGEPLSRNLSKLLLVVVSWCRFHSCLLNSGWESINWSKKTPSHKAISSHSGQVAQELCLSPSLCLLFRLQPVSCASVRPLWDVEMVKSLRTGSMSAHSEPTHAAATPHSCKKWCRFILHPPPLNQRYDTSSTDFYQKNALAGLVDWTPSYPAGIIPQPEPRDCLRIHRWNQIQDLRWTSTIGSCQDQAD